MVLGLALAAVSAAASQVGFLLRHRGAVAAPDIEARHPVRSAVGLFKSRWWTIGYAVAAVAYGLHVAALGLAPFSLVQAVLAGGLVLLAVLAERCFGFGLGRREWAGVALAAVGLAFLALTGESGDSSSADYSVGVMIAFEAVLVGVGAALILSGPACGGRERQGVLLGLSAGCLFTVTHVAVKAMTGEGGGSALAAVASPWMALVIVCAVVAFFASARSLQIGEAVPVIAMTSIAGNASAIPAGIVVFGDPLGSDALEIGLRSVAFVMVIAAGALIPGPVRAADRAQAVGERDARVAPAGA